MNEAEMERIAGWMVRALRAGDDASLLAAIRDEVAVFCRRFPVPGIVGS